MNGRHIRKMRGGAQSHLIEGDDGCFYVVKFVNNPQHRRILINELVSSVFLKYLQISTPDVAMIAVRCAPGMASATSERDRAQHARTHTTQSHERQLAIHLICLNTRYPPERGSARGPSRL